jgi:hypothetical protein
MNRLFSGKWGDHYLLFYALYSKTAIPGLFLRAASENMLCTGSRDLAGKKSLSVPSNHRIFVECDFL